MPNDLPESRDYYPMLEDFLRDVHDQHVTSLSAVALYDGPDGAEAIGVHWNAGALEMTTMAGVLQMQAQAMFTEQAEDLGDTEEGDDDNGAQEV